MRRPRGVALATALMLLALVLVIGLALASSSMLSLNLARQSYLDTRCSLQARSCVNELIARLDKLQASADITLFNPKPTDLNKTFPGRPELVPGCWVTFDHNESGYSTDNLLGEGPVAGWADHGKTTTSVPPFTLELILHARQGGYERSYRALVRRTWPYAVYSGSGPIILTGDPEPNAQPDKGSHVRGRVHSAVRESIPWYALAAEQALPTPRNMLFSLMTSGLRVQRDNLVPAQVGPALLLAAESYTLLGSPAAGRPHDVPAGFTLNRTPQVPSSGRSEGNSLKGSIDYTDELKKKNRQPEVTDGNTFQGTVNYREAARSPLSDIDPGTGDGYQSWLPPARVFIARNPANGKIVGQDVVPWPPQNPLAVYPNEAKPIYLLWDEVSLSGGPGKSSYYVVPGHLVNRIITENPTAYPEGPVVGDLGVRQYGFGLKLEDCVLHVKGDVDLCDLTGDDTQIKGIEGNGATLIVEGQLSVNGAEIRAGDRGMVIYAKQINLAGVADFSGLLVASDSVSVVPQPGKHVKIRGGIVTHGNPSVVEGLPGIVLRNVDVQYDPRYLKSLSSCGEYVLTAWEAL